MSTRHDLLVNGLIHPYKISIEACTFPLDKGTDHYDGVLISEYWLNHDC
jgi:hypothetical protein